MWVFISMDACCLVQQAPIIIDYCAVTRQYGSHEGANKILSLCYGVMRVLMGWDYCCYLWQILHDLLFGHIELRFMWLKEWDVSLFSFM